MNRPIESDYVSHVAYTRALEEYCNKVEADIAKLIWPFPTKLPPAKPSKPIPINPENYEDAPF